MSAYIVPSLYILLVAMPMSAQINVPNWGVGILAVKNVASSNSSSSDFGSGMGAELSWQFLKDHAIQGRARVSAAYINEGMGGFDTQPTTDINEKQPITWKYWSKGSFESISCDWIFTLRRQYGPYVIAGVGIGFIQQNRHIVAHDPNNLENPDSWRFEKSNISRLLPVVGIGWRFSNCIELEIRDQIDRLQPITYEHPGSVNPGTSPENNSLPMITFAIRARI